MRLTQTKGKHASSAPEGNQSRSCAQIGRSKHAGRVQMAAQESLVTALPSRAPMPLRIALVA